MRDERDNQNWLLGILKFRIPIKRFHSLTHSLTHAAHFTYNGIIFFHCNVANKTAINWLLPKAERGK